MLETLSTLDVDTAAEVETVFANILGETDIDSFQRNKLR